MNSNRICLCETHFILNRDGIAETECEKCHVIWHLTWHFNFLYFTHSFKISANERFAHQSVNIFYRFSFRLHRFFQSKPHENIIVTTQRSLRTYNTMTATDQMRQMLDQLMGTSRNGKRICCCFWCVEIWVEFGGSVAERLSDIFECNLIVLFMFYKDCFFCYPLFFRRRWSICPEVPRHQSM